MNIWSCSGSCRIRAIDEEYLNDILNINIKLDNQEAMHNPLDPERQLAEERAIWLQQREQLQQERGRRQYELRQAYERMEEKERNSREEKGSEGGSLKDERPDDGSRLGY